VGRSWGPLNAVKYVSIVTASVGGGTCTEKRNIYLFLINKRRTNLMAEILIGIISGFVSRNGHGRRHNINIMPFYIYGSRATHSTSHKSSIFYTYFCCSNNNKCKAKIYKF
jgi:hypothetical protein